MSSHKFACSPLQSGCEGPLSPVRGAGAAGGAAAGRVGGGAKVEQEAEDEHATLMKEADAALGITHRDAQIRAGARFWRAFFVLCLVALRGVTCEGALEHRKELERRSSGRS